MFFAERVLGSFPQQAVSLVTRTLLISLRITGGEWSYECAGLDWVNASKLVQSRGALEES